MSGWRLARSLVQLRAEVNAAWPGRDLRSDGSIGDPAHASRTSDHNPNSAGVVQAIDVDEHTDPSETSEDVGRWLAEGLRASGDPRVKYVIYEQRMFSSYAIPSAGVLPWVWRNGTGHLFHVHVSVADDPALYDDPSPWGLADTTTARPAEEDHMLRPCRHGDRGTHVRALQEVLKRIPGVDCEPDGIYGDGTAAALSKVIGGPGRVFAEIHHGSLLVRMVDRRVAPVIDEIVGAINEIRATPAVAVAVPDVDHLLDEVVRRVRLTLPDPMETPDA